MWFTVDRLTLPSKAVQFLGSLNNKTIMTVSSSVEKGFRSRKVGFLNKFPCGSHGTIVEIIAEPELHGRLMGMGLFVGTRFHLLQGGQESKLPLLLAVGDTRIAFGPEIAKSVLVEK